MKSEKMIALNLLVSLIKMFAISVSILTEVN